MTLVHRGTGLAYPNGDVEYFKLGHLSSQAADGPCRYSTPCIHLYRIKAGQPGVSSHLILQTMTDKQPIQQWTDSWRSDIYTVHPANMERRGKNKSLENCVWKKARPIALRSVRSKCSSICDTMH